MTIQYSTTYNKVSQSFVCFVNQDEAVQLYKRFTAAAGVGRYVKGKGS